MIEELRGDEPRFVFIGELLDAEARRREKRKFYDAATAAYTPQVATETLDINEQFPMSEA